MDSFSISTGARSLEEGDSVRTALASRETAGGRMSMSSLLRDNLCDMKWVPEKTHRPGTLRPVLPLKEDTYEKTLPLLWTNLPVDIDLTNPVEVIVDKAESYVNKELFTESPLLSFPAQNLELSNTKNPITYCPKKQ